MELKYYLKDGYYVYYSFYDEDHSRLVGSTSIKVQEKGNMDSLSKPDKNTLNLLVAAIDRYVGECRLAGRFVYKEHVKDLIVKHLKGGKGKVSKHKTVLSVMLQVHEQAKNGLIKNDGDNFSASWFNILDYTINSLDKFPAFRDLPIDKLEAKDIRAYQNKLVSSGITRNAVATYNAMLLGALRKAKEAGLHSNSEVENRSLTFKKEKLEHHVFYTVDELVRLYRTDFGDRVNRIRDIFVFNCFTCLRHSDYFNNDYRECIIGNNIVIKTQKKNSKVVIPLHPIVKEILERYNYYLPKVERSTLAKNLKAMMEEAGFTDKVLFSRTVGGVKKTEYKTRAELTSTHTARRCFATNAFLADMPLDQIMKVGGWKSVDSFARYLRSSGEQIADLVAKSPFFSAFDTTIYDHPAYNDLQKAYEDRLITDEAYKAIKSCIATGSFDIEFSEQDGKVNCQIKLKHK